MNDVVHNAHIGATAHHYEELCKDNWSPDRHGVMRYESNLSDEEWDVLEACNRALEIDDDIEAGLEPLNFHDE